MPWRCEMILRLLRIAHWVLGRTMPEESNEGRSTRVLLADTAKLVSILPLADLLDMPETDARGVKRMFVLVSRASERCPIDV